jgi:hypothetical protein
MAFASLLLAADVAAGWSLGGVVVWIAGLICGAFLMAALTTDWQRLPAYLRLWSRALKAQAGWALLAVGSIGILAFY